MVQSRWKNSLAGSQKLLCGPIIHITNLPYDLTISLSKTLKQVLKFVYKCS